MSRNKVKLRNQDVNIVSNLQTSRYKRIHSFKNSILKSRFKIYNYSILKIHGKIHYLHKIDKDVYKSRRCLFSLQVSSISHSFEVEVLFMMQHFEIDVAWLGGNLIINWSMYILENWSRGSTLGSGVWSMFDSRLISLEIFLSSRYTVELSYHFSTVNISHNWWIISSWGKRGSGGRGCSRERERIKTWYICYWASGHVLQNIANTTAGNQGIDKTDANVNNVEIDAGLVMACAPFLLGDRFNAQCYCHNAAASMDGQDSQTEFSKTVHNSVNFPKVDLKLSHSYSVTHHSSIDALPTPTPTQPMHACYTGQELLSEIKNNCCDK